MKIDDLPKAYQDQARQQLQGKAARPPLQAVRPPVGVRPPEDAPAPKKKRQPRPRVPNTTEAEFYDHHLRGKGARYEGVMFRLENGHRYSPDWVYWEGGRMVCVECKGTYRLHSHGRARLAFDQARVEFPEVKFVWYEKGKGIED